MNLDKPIDINLVFIFANNFITIKYWINNISISKVVLDRDI